jgi:protein-tyrosine kinase
LVRKLSRAESLRIRRSLVTYNHPQSPISDQFRTIRSHIEFTTAEHPKVRSLLITSPGYGEGKSTTAINLAISLAQRGDKVLLIEANYRKPSVHNVFNVKALPGMTNVLAGQVLLREAVHRTEIGRLEFLTSGPALYNSAEMIGSQNMRELIETASKHYDCIVFDAPPILETSDTTLLASLCDGVILVLRSGKTKSDAAVEAKKLMDLAKVNVLGVIMNDQ